MNNSVDKVTAEKGARIARHFVGKYGKEKAKLICQKLAVGITVYTEYQLLQMGEKIALLNGWFKY